MDIALTPAERCYQNIKRNVANYQMRRKEQTNEKTKRYQAKIREEQPERHELLKAQKREYYHTIVKPRLLASKALLAMTTILEMSEFEEKL